MKLSIVIVNYNVEHFLEQCLISVRSATQGIDCEVFVVDNASVDGSVDMVQSRFPEVTLITNTNNLGFSMANNQAILESRGEYVLLLNPDTVVEEDTFKTCLRFMEEHQDAGGLGVKMLDGKGRFLPESKRGLPTPRVAFYKIFGLSSLFPKSRNFGRYHLGYLDEDSTHQVDVLSGAFMMLRKKALDEVGHLDEDYFMYGEDIDLSYRLTQHGFKNYYLPSARIIHYKGESTKKSSVNYVLVFYNAMRIFAKKHFSAQHARAYNRLIEAAIYARAGLSLVKRFLSSIWHVALDFALIWIGLRISAHFYELNTGIDLPDRLIGIALPIYAAVWVVSSYLSSAYDRPLVLRRSLLGVIYGTIAILILYALLPDHLRFSRILILLGTLVALIGMTLTRIIIKLISKESWNESSLDKKYAIVGSEAEYNRIKKMMHTIGIKDTDVHQVLPSENLNHSMAQLKEMHNILKIEEIIFCAKDITSESIIEHMAQLGGTDLSFKIAPPESMFIIGSNNRNDPGDLLAYEMNAISRAVNRRNKRILDVLSSILVLILAPLLMWFQSSPLRLWRNAFSVLVGRMTWVGYDSPTAAGQRLPKLRPAVVDTSFHGHMDIEQSKKSNILYARDYRPSQDLSIMFRKWNVLGS